MKQFNVAKLNWALHRKRINFTQRVFQKKKIYWIRFCWSLCKLRLFKFDMEELLLTVFNPKCL